MSSEEEHLQEANGKLYTKELVLQDCNAYIKQVDLIKILEIQVPGMNIITGEHDYFCQTIVEFSIPFMLSENTLKEKI